MNQNVRLANEAWEALFTAHTNLMRGFLESDAWSDVTMREYDVLYTLTKHNRPVRLNELRDSVLLSQPALSRLIDRLVDRGLVSRTPDPDDRRAVALELTEAGREVQRTAGRIHAVDVSRAMDTFDDDELTSLKTLCGKLTAAVTSQESLLP